MLSQIKVKAIVMGIFLLFFTAVPPFSYADFSIGIGIGDHEHDHDHGDHRYYGWHDHPHYGMHMHYIPARFFTIWVGGQKYYYADGLYYTYVGDGDYIVVNPPIGAHVDVIPPDFHPVNIHGRIYYTDDGVYYVLTEHHGYKVVPPPVVYEEPAPVIIQQPQQVVVAPPPAPVDTQDSFPVNIPNGTGAYTTVMIKKSGNGYVGPQGEFYATFPTVSQLKAMYVK